MVNLKIPPEHSSFRDKKWMEAIASEVEANTTNLDLGSTYFFSTSSIFSTTSTSYVTVTSFTQAGVVVPDGYKVILTCDTGHSASVTGSSGLFRFSFHRDSSALGEELINYSWLSNTTGRTDRATFHHIDTPSAGTYTYDVRVLVDSGAVTLYLAYRNFSIRVVR